MEITFGQFLLGVLIFAVGLIVLYVVLYAIHLFINALIDDLKNSYYGFKVFLGWSIEIVYYGAIVLFFLGCLYFLLFCLC